MTQKPRKGDLREKNPKKFHGGACIRTPLEAYAFGARLGKRSVFILDPRLTYVQMKLFVKEPNLAILQVNQLRNSSLYQKHRAPLRGYMLQFVHIV